MKSTDLLFARAARAGWQHVRSSGSRWDFSVSNGKPHLVSVRRENGILEFSAGPLEMPRTRWEILLANRGLAPPSRMVLNRRDECYLRCEVPPADGSRDDVLGPVFGSVTAALEPAAATIAGAINTEAEPWDFAGAAAEAELAGRMMSDGRFRLDAWGDAARAAMLGPDLAARVKMLNAEKHSATVREAVATLLLRMTSGVRFARAAGGPDGAAWLEVRWSASPSAAELQTAVTALALASACTEELAVLTHEEVARLFLAAGGPGRKGGDLQCQSLPLM
jgi:hypothetical protein